MALMLPSILALVLTNQIITKYGSDVNGIFVTINQVVAFLVLLEGGFTLATNVALFKPYKEKNYKFANSILSATSKSFNIIGVVFAIIAVLIAVFLPSVLKSNVSNIVITQLMLLASLNTLYSFFFEYKYRVLFQTSQQEYLVLTINAVSSLIGYSLAIVAIQLGYSIVLVRIALLVPIIIRFPTIYYLHHNRFPWVNFNETPNFKAISGTLDVFVQKISDMLFFNTPVIVISIMVGSVFASVYAIYNSIFSLIRNVTYSFVMAPHNAFGQILAESGTKSIIRLFHLYQTIIMMIATILLTTTTIMILPFINLFTQGVNDINYIDANIAFLSLVAGLLEITHISSRGILNISGKFKYLKKIVAISSIINLVVSIILTNFIGIYGAIIGTIVGYLVLTPLTVIYTHKTYLNCGFDEFFKIVIPNIGLSFISVLISRNFEINLENYFEFIILGFIIFSLISIATILINLLFNRRLIIEAKEKILKSKKLSDRRRK